MKGMFGITTHVAIDIGTTKISVLVAEKKDDGSIEITASSKTPSHGLKKGVVVDIEKTVESIKTAIAEAEFIAGHPIDKAAIGISGSHIHSLNSHGAVPIKKRQISPLDITNVLQAAKAIAVPEGQQIIHVMPQFYTIDGSEPIIQPLGMAGIRLEALVHIITASVASVQNLVHCCQRAGVQVSDIVLEQIASALAVLSPDERELGVGVLDIGGGTADFAVYQHGTIRFTKVIPVAGNHFTQDIAVGLQTTVEEALRIKEQFGSAISFAGMTDVQITCKQVAGFHTQVINQQTLVNIIQPRAEELLHIVQQTIEANKLQRIMTTGLVLTGGGSLLPGLVPLASSILGMPVRIGMPAQQKNIASLISSPIYATGYGLLLYNMQTRQGQFEQLQGTTVSRVFHAMKSLLTDFL
ncbi:cell division protein FtsA [Candidatus Dependentiae bacterium]|nr:cell division protein FtsA [Candidatus Dependentiae bacterium]